MNKNLLALLLAACMIFTSAAPAFAENEIPDSDMEAAEELEEIDEPIYVGAVGDAELIIADAEEELITDESADAALVGVYASTGTNGLPVLDITLNGITLDEIKAGNKSTSYKGNSAELSVDGSSETYSDTTVKGRGNSTWYLPPKKPFQLKFDKKLNLFGQGKAKKWILLANYMDYSHLRNDIAFRLASENGIPNALPQGQFIEVCFNGEYEGLYYLTRKVEVGTVDLSDGSGIITEIENTHDPDDLYCDSENGTRVMLKETVIDSDDAAEQQAVLDNFMVSYNQFENAARDKDWQTVQALADVDSFAKYFLLSDFSSDQDMFGTSCYMHKDGDGDVIHAGPMWDFDIAYASGQMASSPEINNPYRSWAYMDVRETARSREEKLWAPIYEYLMNIPEFRALVKETYQQSVRPTLIAAADYVIDMASTINGAISKDLAKWHPGTSGMKESMKLWTFLRNRTSYFDFYYGDPQELDGFYTMIGAHENYTVTAEKGSDGFYTITDTYGWVLGVNGDAKDPDAPVKWCTEANGSDAQKWLPLANGAFVSKESGLFLTQAADGSLSIRNASISNETLSEEQTFLLLSTAPVGSAAVYKITSSLNSSKVLTVRYGALTNGGNVQLETFSNMPEDLWTLEDQGDGTYMIRNLRSGLVLDIAGGRTSNGANVQQYTANGTDAQKFILNELTDGSKEIINVKSLKVLDVAGGRQSDGTNVQLYTCNSSKAQSWQLTEVGTLPYISGRYKIQSALGNADKALSVAGTSMNNNANVLIWDGAVSKSAVWRIERNADNTCIIRNICSGKVLDVAGAGKRAGTNVHQYQFGIDNAAQKWILLETPDGTLTIYSVCSGLALDVAGARNKDGANVQTYTPNGSIAQRWVIGAV